MRMMQTREDLSASKGVSVLDHSHTPVPTWQNDLIYLDHADQGERRICPPFKGIPVDQSDPPVSTWQHDLQSTRIIQTRKDLSAFKGIGRHTSCIKSDLSDAWRENCFNFRLPSGNALCSMSAFFLFDCLFGRCCSSYPIHYLRTCFFFLPPHER